jgi:DNA-binding NarL/FixJ family response regulator
VREPGPRVTAALRGAGLSSREAEVVSGLALGQSVVAIAEQLGVTSRTIHKHQQASYAKLGVTSRTQAARAAWALVGGGGS